MRGLYPGEWREDPTHVLVPTVYERSSQSGGVIAGSLSILFGLLGIFSFGIVFVPLAFLCCIVGLVRGLLASSGSGIGISLLGAFLTVFGAVISPTVWALLAGSAVLGSTMLSAHGGSAPSVLPLRSMNAAPFRSATFTPNADSRGGKPGTVIPDVNVEPSNRSSSIPTRLSESARPLLPEARLEVGQTPLTSPNGAPPISQRSLSASVERQAEPFKRDIRGLSPGDQVNVVMTRLRTMGFTCSWNLERTYFDCSNNKSMLGSKEWQQFRLFTAANALVSVELNFKTGEKFPAVVAKISDEFQAPPKPKQYSENEMYWILADGSQLEYSQLSDGATLKMYNRRITTRLRALENDARRNTYPAPRF